ncbi:hypothetical protein ACVWZ8_004921 [Arthrobacter sp. UYCu723]
MLDKSPIVQQHNRHSASPGSAAAGPRPRRPKDPYLVSDPHPLGLGDVRVDNHLDRAAALIRLGKRKHTIGGFQSAAIRACLLRTAFLNHALDLTGLKGRPGPLPVSPERR